MLSLLPDIDKNMQRNQDGNPYWIKDRFVLANENVVDVFIKLSFHQPIKRIDWNGSVLSVDFRQDGLQPLSNEEILEDLFRLCQFSFNQTQNIDKLLVRIMYDQETWLLTMDANRSDWSFTDDNEAPTSYRSLKAFLEKHTNIQYSKRWRFEGSV